MADEMLARLNRIYPNSNFVKIQKYNPDQWVTREYDSKFDIKGPMNKWKSNPLSYDEAQEAVEEGFRVGWVVPKNMCVVDIDNADNPESQNKLINLLTKWEVKYSYNYSFRGMHLVFEDPSGAISSDSHSKCALNIDIDTRANGTGYIVLPCNDPHRKWGQWNDVVEEIPYFLKPILKDGTPSFIGLAEGDGRNNALFRWRTKLIQTHKLTDQEIEKCIRIINEFILAQPMSNNELFKTVLKERDKKEELNPLDKENIYNKLAEDIIARYDIVAFGDNFYKFNGSYYESIEPVDIERIIHFDISKNIPKRGRSEIMDYLRIKTQVSEQDFDKDWYKIACKNGIINLVNGELTQPNKTEINTIYIDYMYNPNAEYSVRIDEFMKQVTGGDILKMNFLYQIAGYCLLKKNVFEKFFIFQGEGGTGKSTFMNIIAKMCGDQNTANIGLADFDKDYYLAQLISKLVNIDDDVVDGKTLENTGRFKSIISGNVISVRQIYQPVVKYLPYVTCVFSCNKLPRIMDKTSGLYRRIILIELNNKVEKPDPLFMLKLTDKDMEYFLYKSVQAIKQALEEGHFRINMSEQDLLRKFRCRQSPLNEWLFENDMTLGDVVGKRCMAMYTVYLEWSRMNGYTKPMAMYSFKEDICSLYDVEVEFEISPLTKTKSTIQIFTKRGKYDPNVKPF